MTIDKRDKPASFEKSRRPSDTEGFKRKSDGGFGHGGEESDRRPRRNQLDTRRSGGENDGDRGKRTEQYQQYQRQRWDEGPGDARGGGGGDRRFQRRSVPRVCKSHRINTEMFSIHIVWFVIICRD